MVSIIGLSLKRKFLNQEQENGKASIIKKADEYINDEISLP